MGKNKQQQSTNNKKLKNGKRQGNPEVKQRLEFLATASKFMAEVNNPTLSCFYGTFMKTLGKKCVLRLEPKVKRGFCKKCTTTLDPTTTCSLELVQPNNPKVFPYVNCICKVCDTNRKFILNPAHKLWDTNPTFIIEMHQKLENALAPPNIDKVYITESNPVNTITKTNIERTITDDCIDSSTVEKPVETMSAPS